MSAPPPNPYQPGPQQPYGGYAVQPPQHPQATTVLVLGILGLLLCQLASPVAWVMGGRARREIEAARGQLGGSGMVTAGWVMGIIGTVLLALSLLVVVAAVVIVVIAGLSSS